MTGPKEVAATPDYSAVVLAPQWVKNQENPGYHQL
jgi:hypothetical protein